MAFFRHRYSSFPIHCPLRLNANLSEGLDRTLAEVFIIINHQHPPWRQLHILHLGICLFQIKRYVELTSLAGCTL